MAWKQLFQFEGEDAEAVLRPDIVAAKHPLRVTVEVQERECCARWRGAAVSCLTSTLWGAEMYAVTCVFCPECGAKL